MTSFVGSFSVDDAAVVAALDEVRAAVGPAVTDALRAQWATPVGATIRAQLPSRTGAWRSQVTVYAEPAGAAIRWGVEPWRAWLEFGGRRPRDRQSRPWQPAGRWVWPTALAAEPAMTGVASDAVDRLSRRAGLD